MSGTQDSHEQGVEAVDDFEGNLENGDDESQDASGDEEDEGSIQNRFYHCYAINTPHTYYLVLPYSSAKLRFQD